MAVELREGAAETLPQANFYPQRIFLSVAVVGTVEESKDAI